MRQVTDEEYEELQRLRGGSDEDDFYRDLDSVPDGDQAAVREVLKKHGRLLEAEESEEPFEREFTEEETHAFYADLDSVPDGDKNAVREVLAKHGRLAE